MRLKHLSIAVIALTMATGCTGPDLTGKYPSNASSFDQHLYKNYRDFGRSEGIFDFVDSRHFKTKAKDILDGKSPEPEMVGDWHLDEVYKYEAVLAREALVKALKVGKTSNPKLAASAQFNFDCWLEQREENWQNKDIRKCRHKFYDGLRVLLGSYKTNFDLSVNFDFDSDMIKHDDKAKIKAFSRTLSDSFHHIIIAGHADRKGRASYNDKLSLKRAESVKAELVRNGVDEYKIKIAGFGEQLNRVATPDGVKHADNRRAEVFIRLYAE
ncbi:MAG: OmpA family protein [Pseudomonadota bacterium]